MKAARIAKLCLLFVAVSLLTRAYMAPAGILDIDETLNITGSRVLMNGGLLYTDFVDNKPPLLYGYYAFAQLLFGHGLFSVHLFTLLFTMPLSALACAAFFDFDRRGAVAGLLLLVYSASFLAHDMHAAHAELPMICAGAWALVLCRNEERGRSFVSMFGAGFLVGVGVLFKYQILAWLAAIVAASFHDCICGKRYWRGILLSLAGLAGAALPLLLTYWWFVLHQGAEALLYWTIINNLKYSANPIPLREAAGRFAGSAFPFVLASLPLWWLARRLHRTEESSFRKILLMATLLCTVPAVLIGFRFFPHYFIQFYIPLCLAAAPAASLLLTPWSRPGRALIGLSAAIWILFAVINAVLYYGNTNVYRERDPVFQRVADRLRNDSCYAGANLFVWGYTPLYYYADLPPASRFVVIPQSGLTSYISGNLGSIRRDSSAKPIRHDHWAILMSDLERNRATYIIDTSPAGIFRWDRYPVRDYPLLQAYLDEHYQEVDNIDGIVLYRRHGCDQK